MAGDAPVRTDIAELEVFIRPGPSPIGTILTLVFHYEDGIWMGACDELGTATYADDGEDRADVRAQLGALIAHELNALEADGKREQVFAERGIDTFPLPDHISKKQMPRVPDLPHPAWLGGHATPLIAV